MRKNRFADKKSYQEFLKELKDPKSKITDLEIAYLRIGNERPTEQDVLDLIEAIKANTSLKRVDMNGIDLNLNTLDAIKGIFSDERGNIPNTTLEYIDFSKERNRMDLKHFDQVIKDIDLFLKSRKPEFVPTETLIERGLLTPEEEEFNRITKPAISPHFDIKKSQSKKSIFENNEETEKHKPRPE